MTDNGVVNNTWLKLAVVSLVGIVIIFTVLWGINTFNRNYGYGNMNMGYGYQNQMYGMQMGQQNGMNIQGTMNGNMQGGMGMMGGVNGNMQGGMGMMGGMGMH